MVPECTYFDSDTSVRGELSTSDVILEGSFEGKIIAEGKLVITKTGRVNAQISAKKLMIEEGAIYNGGITLTNSHT